MINFDAVDFSECCSEEVIQVSFDAQCTSLIKIQPNMNNSHLTCHTLILIELMYTDALPNVHLA